MVRYRQASPEFGDEDPPQLTKASTTEVVMSAVVRNWKPWRLTIGRRKDTVP